MTRYPTASSFLIFTTLTFAACLSASGQSGSRATTSQYKPYGFEHLSASTCDCASCGNHHSGSCEHCPDNCPQSKKPIVDKLKSLLAPCKDSQVTGFCVEEVQYGANAGYPSFGTVSHGAWYTGPVKHLIPTMSPFEKLKLRDAFNQSVQHHYCRRCKSVQCQCVPEYGDGYGYGYLSQQRKIPVPKSRQPSNLESRTASLQDPGSYPLDQLIEKRR
ncbi:MAG: hypothetical protein AAGA30_03055 [Planctomycetota bacterium]